MHMGGVKPFITKRFIRICGVEKTYFLALSNYRMVPVTDNLNMKN